jgi:Fic family protein
MATPDQKTRAGRVIRQPEGYSAFIPAPLPPVPPLRFDSQLATVLAGAGTALGRLDGVAATLPNPELFVAMYVRREAVLSSQIEGTQSTLDDVLAYEIDSDRGKLPHDVEEVVNYVTAVLYLSHYLKQHRGTYYDRLMAVRNEGDWEGWLRFFLTGVATVAREAEQTARHIVQLREQLRVAAQAGGVSVNVLKLMDHLFKQPIINVKAASEALHVSIPAANRMINELHDNAILAEVTGGNRNRMFRFAPYLDLFDDVVESDTDGTVAQPTQYEDAG